MAQTNKPWYKKWWAVLIFVFVGLAIIGSFLPDSNNSQSQQTSNQNNIQTQTPSSTSKTWHEVTSFSGKGNQDTSSFYIKGEKVRITATTCCGSAGIGTYSAVDLEKEEGGYLGAGLSISTDGSEEGQGETTYRNLDAGEYYISIITGVNWEVKVEEYS